MRMWKKVLISSARVPRAAGTAQAGPPRTSAASAQCIWCGAGVYKEIAIEHKGHRLTFNVCSDECQRRVGRLFADGTIIDKMFDSLVAGVPVALPGGFPPEVVRVKESVERQLKAPTDEGPLEVL